jgi:ribosome-associated heat shock protein Hsp15
MSEPFLRLDKWLWYARFFKSRSTAGRLCAAGRVRITGETVTKAHHKVRPGDVITFPQARQIRVVKVLALGARRGPATEAHLLYEDLQPPTPAGARPFPAAPAHPGGRPTKRDRRALERLKATGRGSES